MPIDTALIGALHVEYLVEQGLRGDEHPHHTLFQTSTIGALLDGNYEGDVTFAELGEHGDFGLGTFDALDGEMICLDGDFYRVRADGRAYAVDGGSKTPFAVVTFFEPDLLLPLADLEDFAALCAHLEGVVGDRAVCHAVRVDGYFDYAKTRSVSRPQGQPRGLPVPRPCRGAERGGLPLPLHQRGQERRRAPAGVPDLARRAPRRPRVEPEARAAGRRRCRVARHFGGATGRTEARREGVGRSPRLPRLAEGRSRRGRGSQGCLAGRLPGPKSL